jgi:excisionase family DNA binding protein
MVKRVLSVNETCERLNCSRPTVYELIDGGEIESYHQGRYRKIIESSVDAYQQRRLDEEAARRRELAAPA